jgi:uncharacterized phage protein (TIGR01671 family)
MRDIYFRVWYRPEQKMYYRGYQKLSHVLLCDDDKGKNEGKGIPAKRANYDECEFLESTNLTDKNGVEIFEGDRLLIRTKKKTLEGIAGEVPDMFRSRNLHPLQSLLEELRISPDDILEMEVLGNRYESRKPS